VLFEKPPGEGINSRFAEKDESLSQDATSRFC